MTSLQQIIGKPHDQIAFASASAHAIRRAKDTLGGEWINDRVTAVGEVYGRPGRNIAELSFNYHISPVEFELLRYVEGNSWLTDHNLVSQIGLVASHFGWHTEEGETDRISERLSSAGFPVVQQVRTEEHTNPYLLDIGRRYRYVIHSTRHLVGFDTKLIQRIEA